MAQNDRDRLRRMRLMQEAVDERLSTRQTQELRRRLEVEPEAKDEFDRLRGVDERLREAPFERAPQQLAMKIMSRLAEAVPLQQMSHAASLALALALALVTAVLLPLLAGLAWLMLSAIGSVGRFFNSFDGANRQNRIRYDTPTFFGFKGSVSFIDKHNIDSAIWYEGKLAGTEIQGAVGFCHTEGSQSAGSNTCFGNGTTINGITQLNGSVSVLTPIGLGATMAGAQQWRELAVSGTANGHDLFNNTAFNLQPSIFYTTKLTELGATTFEYAFQYCEDCGTTSSGTKDDKGIGHSVQIMQQVDSIGGDYFLGFRYVDVEANGDDNTEGLWFVGGGFRQRF